MGVPRVHTHQPLETVEPEPQYQREGGITPLMSACQQARDNQVRHILHRNVSNFYTFSRLNLYYLL